MPNVNHFDLRLARRNALVVDAYFFGWHKSEALTQLCRIKYGLTHDVAETRRRARWHAEQCRYWWGLLRKRLE